MITNVELDHHSRWGSRAELLDAFARFAAPASGLALGADPDLDSVGATPAGRRVERFDADRPGPAALELAGARRHNVLNARAALAGARRSPASSSSAGAAALASFPGIVRRQQRKGSRAGARDLRRLRPSSDRGRGDPGGDARARTAAADRRLPAAPVLAHEGARGAIRRRARRRRRGRGARRLPGARASRWASSPGSAAWTSPGPTADRAGGRPVWWLRDVETAERALAPRLGDGDLLVTIGAGDVFRLADELVERGRPDERGPARDRARLPARAADHRARRRRGASCSRGRAIRGRARRAAALGGAARGSPVEVVGSGSNLLVADDGVRGLVLKLAGELAEIEREGDADRLRRRRAAAVGRGEGRRLGADRARVRDQHPGHGRRRGADERERLRRPARRGARVGRRLHRRRRRAPRAPDELGFDYRRSALRPGEVVSRRFVRARRRPIRRRSRRRSPRCARSAARRSRRGSRPSARRSRTPTRTRAPRAAPPASCSRRPAARARGRRRAALAQARELRREHRRGDDRRRARGDGRRPPARPRAVRDRARARGPGARRGRVARRLGARHLG